MLTLVAAVALPVALAATNPLLVPWTGPYGGVPPFDKVKVELIQPALEAAMAEKLAAVERIANDPAPPTFENTLAALERSGRTLDRVRAIYDVWISTMATPEVQALERDMVPRLAALDDRITQNGKLFARIATVYESRAESCRTPEQARLAWLIHTRFVRAGARLDPAGKKRVAEINERLATLGTNFSQNVLADEDGQVLVLESERDLAGLPPSFRSEAAASATARGLAGKWAVPNARGSVEPFLTYADRRDLREKAWRSFVTRGDHEGERDNNKIVAEIISLRAERARLLGYPSHAHLQTEDRMARTPDRATALMEAVWPSAVGRVREEVTAMQAVADAEGAGITIAPWDYRHYAEKVRKAKYDLDERQVKPYLQFDRLRDGMFWVAGQLYGFRFKPAREVPVYHPDVRVWAVSDTTGKAVGLLFIDPWARPGKQSGAWEGAYRRQERMDGAVLPIVAINLNAVKGKPGEPMLLTWDDAQRSLLHEFGHAVHDLSSNVRYRSLSSEVPSDFGELPSTLMERWIMTPEFLARYARHFKTGNPMPKDLAQRIARSATFNVGFNYVEFLASALVDMKAYSGSGEPFDAAGFERSTLAALGMPMEIVMRHRMPHFNHVFGNSAGGDYSAGYYSYIWSDVLSADAFEAFTEGKGPYDKAVARQFQTLVLSVGNTVDPAEAYRAFRGRDPAIGAFLRRLGFPEAGAGKENASGRGF
jgi:peptidyl-dipeptidase Dcp